MQVIGVKRMNFKAQDGNQISGYQVFCSKPIEQNGEGLEVEKFFISDLKVQKGCPVPRCGEDVEPVYNRYGKVDTFVIK